MTMSFRKLLTTAAATVALALTFAGGVLSPVFAADDHIINMQDVDIKAFIENVGIVTGRTFVIDPRVNGKVNIVSEKKSSPSSKRFCVCMAIRLSVRQTANIA